jgi:hypothetical protein
MTRIHLLIWSAMELGWESIIRLDIERKLAPDYLVGVGRMSLLAEVGLSLQGGGVLVERRNRGLRVTRPDISLAIVVELGIQPGLRIRSGQLGVDGAVADEVRVRVGIVSAAVLVKDEPRRAKLVVPRLAGKLVRVPATNAAAIALIHRTSTRASLRVKRGIT